MPALTNKSYLVAFILITSLFFLWGFAHNLDPILIPHLKRSFTLTTTQATLVEFAVYSAYFVMAIPAGIIIKKFGYKIGIIVGLLLFAIGSFMFIPAANTQLYFFFLVALFVIACGLTILETAANPFASALGDPETSTLRLNFSQSFNGLAAALAPIIGAAIILVKGPSDEDLNKMSESARKIALASEASSVKTPYFILGCILIVIAIIFAFTKIPKIQSESVKVTGRNIFHAFEHRQLTWGVIAQFFYVGAQVCVFSLFVLYASKVANITEKAASTYAGIGGIAFLIGRFVGTGLMSFIKPQRLLALYSFICILLCVVAIVGQGMVAIYAVIGIYFFMSIMFPTIFSLGIKGLGDDTEFGSSLIIMAIVGGAILPRVFGIISDSTGNIQYGYIVPMVCFIVILFFGLSGYKTSKKEVLNSIDNI